MYEQNYQGHTRRRKRGRYADGARICSKPSGARISSWAKLEYRRGLNVKLAKRAGLLHDIGKVPDTESELPHAILGMQWAEKYGEKEEVCNAIGAHHDEIEMKSLISPIIQVCDAISGARPGARRQVLDSYIQRLKDLEDIAFGFNGVKNAYAIQAGRELRVIVESEKVSDEAAAKKAADEAEAKIADYNNKIEYLDKKQQEIDKLHRSQVEQLEAISGLSAEDAKNQLVESLKAEAKTNAMSYIQDKIGRASCRERV